MYIKLPIPLMLIVLSTLFAPSFSQAFFCSQKTHVFYGNGMFINHRDITDSAGRLEDLLRSKGDLPKDE